MILTEKRNTNAHTHAQQEEAAGQSTSVPSFIKAATPCNTTAECVCVSEGLTVDLTLSVCVCGLRD